VTTRDLDLLSDFNYKTIDQYQELSHTAQDILASSSKMQQACKLNLLILLILLIYD
jgi:hypothetical protein